MYFIFIIPPKPQTHHNLDSHRVCNIQNQLECAYFIIIIVDIYVCVCIYIYTHTLLLCLALLIIIHLIVRDHNHEVSFCFD